MQLANLSETAVHGSPFFSVLAEASEGVCGGVHVAHSAILRNSNFEQRTDLY